MDDVERVMVAMIAAFGRADGGDIVGQVLARAAMAETRRIDAEALQEAIKNGDVWSNGWYVSEWLEQRANAPQQ